MSAIAGMVWFGGSPVPSGEAERLAGAVGCGRQGRSSVWTDAETALVTHSESTAQTEPACRNLLVSGDGRHALVFDGRLDNRRELAATLRDTDPGLESRPDAEIVMAAYCRWSDDCPARLLGDFAFAVWDTAARRLFCARDVTGARPFYYVRNRHLFAFASEEEGLLGLEGVSHRPSPELLAYFLVRTFQDVAPDQSWLDEVKTLLPAHSVTVTPDRMARPVEYWQFEQGPIVQRAGSGEHEQAFLEVFSEAVRCRMPGGRPAAAILSGGMDSAALAAMAGRLATQSGAGAYQAYSVIADNAGSSLESRSILSITRPDHVEPHYLGVPSLAGIAELQDLESAVWANAHPVSNAIPITALMCAAARRDGHEALLHAPCGDLAMGYDPHYLTLLLRQGRIWGTWREAWAASRHHTFLEGQPAARLLLRAAWQAFAPRSLRGFVWKMRAPAPRDPEGLELLNPEFVDSLRIRERIPSWAPGADRYDEASFRRRHAEAVFGPYGVAQTLAGGQRAGSMYGVDLSDPWADRRVLEFFLHLPLDYLFRDGWTKYLARVAFAPDLEYWVRFRSDKEHLGWLLVDRLLRESRDFIDQAINDDLDLIGEYVNTNRVLELHREYRASGEPAVAEQIYDVMTLLLWVRRLARAQP